MKSMRSPLREALISIAILGAAVAALGLGGSRVAASSPLMDALAAESAECFVMANVLLDQDLLDRAALVNIDQGWAVDQLIYKGSASEAAAAFGGELVAWDSREAAVGALDKRGNRVILSLTLLQIGEATVWVHTGSARGVACDSEP